MKKTSLLLTLLFFFSFDLTAKIIYVEPVQNAKYVSIENNIIVGFDEAIEDADLNSMISVKGTLSGTHTGEVILTEDKKRLIFKPDLPFVFNEKVEVKINSIKKSSPLNERLTFTFQTQISKPVGNYGKSIMEEIRNAGYNISTDNYDSLNLPALTVTVSNNPSPGNLYLSNFPYTSIPYTPYLIISDNAGHISYHKEMNRYCLDFKKQPNGLLTYHKIDKFYALDINYNLVDSFACGNGYSTDEHELKILNNGHALLMSYDRQQVDMSLIVPGGNPNAIVIGLIIQELDQNKNVIFQWRSWDHFEITDAPHINLTAATVDYVHGNAIELDNDGNLMISSRHLSEITKINRTTGNIIWRLGGANNQFTFVNDPIGFSYQHDIRRISNGNITLYDNGNYHTPAFSRAVEYNLDETNKIATLVWQYRRNPDIYGAAMGSAQRLRNGNTLISWGSTNPTVTEVTPAGDIALELTLPQSIFTYRTFKDDVNLTLNAKLAIEGLYNKLTNKLNLNDTVSVFLRSVSPPYNIVDSARSNIDSVNFNGNFRFYNVITGTYYISTRHRNGIETWSKSGGEVFSLRGVYSYDFTNSASSAYGNNLVLKGSKYCIFSGDVNKDGNIDLVDLILVSNDASNFISGYVNTDVNGDNVSDLADKIIIYNNSAKFVKVKRP